MSRAPADQPHLRAFERDRARRLAESWVRWYERCQSEDPKPAPPEPPAAVAALIDVSREFLRLLDEDGG